MKRVFFVFGIKRSGNHAIINWLYKMLPNYVHINNLHPKFLTPAYYNLNLVQTTIIENYKDNAWINFRQDNNLIISFEDQDIKTVHEKIVHLCKKCNIEPVTIMIIRDPKNMLASLYKIKKRFDILEGFKNIWINYAEEYLTKKYLQHFIIYDKWFIDQDYRKKISYDLKLTFDDSNHNKIFKHGISSFDGYKFENDTTKMDVLNRANIFKNDSNFENLVSDLKMIELWTKILK